MRLLLPLVGILSLTFIITSVILIREQGELITDQARSEADNLANSMLSSLKTLMTAGDALYVHDWLKRIRSHPDMQRIGILRRDGNDAFQDLRTINQVNAYIGENRFMREPLPLHRQDDLPASSVEQAASGQTVTLEQGSNMTFLLPIKRDAQCASCHGYDASPVRGILRLTLSTEKTALGLQQTALTVSLIAAGAMLMLSWLSYMIIRNRILAPIDQMTQATADITAGNLDARVDTRDGDEIAALGHSFNDMTESLEQTTVSKCYVDQIIYSLGDMLFVTDDDGIIIMINPAVSLTLGFESSELVGKQVTEIVLGGLMTPQEAESLEAGSAINSIDRQILNKAGEKIPVLISVSMLEPSKNKHQLIYAAHDITRQKVAERQMQLAAKVMDTVSNGIIVSDAEHRILMVNPAFTAITGYEAEDVIGRKPGMLQSDEHDEDFYQQLRDKVMSLGYWEGEIWNRRKNGEVYPQWLTISSMRDDTGAITHCVSTFLDISEEKRIHHELEYLANHDSLTNLPNRKLFIDRIEHALPMAKRAKHTVALLFVDIDGFKPVNDMHGHAVGDSLLKAIAVRLRECVRESDTVARIGGDEFTILMEGVDDISHVMPIAEKVLNSMKRPFDVDEVHCRIGASIGISLYPEHADNLNDLVKRADGAMYQAKKLGRNRVCVYRPDADDDKDYMI
ncbi:cyclic di-GMP phosphodiesterase Gmr [Mariprofundus micogutta]|uniref:Cyclic di-GMP phosphodiesterase Gmr n=1 Tax=Mariprofundus micogutta TaxID=1921010 RepID=A0A1L8CMZ5_9PROT|nr:diguanylate cyclase [Mariprofundus micogutta]GAV20277.1 cyclic di-GMP phosphodiesterase Gmr [Mariprofundus micogutta]